MFPRLIALATTLALAASASASTGVVPVSDRGAPILSGTYQRLNGTPDNLARYRGRVVLVVNTASHCGFTEQYGPLQSISRSRRAGGLVVLGFPSNDFNQELPTNGLVARFCKRNFGVSFPMFRIAPVTGPRAIPLFRHLAAPSWSAPPQWNFTKYLVDARGRAAARFDSSVTPASPQMTQAIDALLAERRPS